MNSLPSREYRDNNRSSDDTQSQQYYSKIRDRHAWSEGEFSEESNSNKSKDNFGEPRLIENDYEDYRGNDYGSVNRKPMETGDEDTSDYDRERTGHDSRDHHHYERKRHHHHKKGKKKRHKRRSRRSSSSLSSTSSKTKSRSRSRHSHRSSSRRLNKSPSSSESFDDSDTGRERYHRSDRHEECSRNYPPNSTLMIRGMAPHLSEVHIRDKIAKCGISVKEIRLIRHRDTGVSRGFAFIDFDSVSCAKQYMEHTGGTVLFEDQYEANLIYSYERINADRLLNVMQTDWFCTRCSAHNFKRRDLCYRCHSSRVDDGVAVTSDGVAKTATSTLLLKNLDPLTTDENVLVAIQLRPDLETIPIKAVKISRDSQTNLSWGVCLVETNCIADAIRFYDCLTQVPLEVDKKILTVSYCKQPVQSVALNSAAAAAMAAAKWSTTAPNSMSSSDAEIQHLAEYSASLYAKNDEEKASYLTYYLTYYRNQHSQGEKLTSGYPNTLDTAAHLGPLAVSSTGISVHPIPNRSASPDMSRLQFDESSSYYYDPVTLFYYDGVTQYFYDSVEKQYLYWDSEKREYTNAFSNTNPSSEKVDVKKAKQKDAKIRVCKSVLKDTLKQAAKFNDKKSIANSNSRIEVPGCSSEVGASATKLTNDLLPHEAKNFQISAPLAKISTTKGVSMVETCERASCSEDEDVLGNTNNVEEFMDVEQLACTLCKRRFHKYEMLRKHTQLSTLHKTNLANLRKSESDTLLAKSSSIPATSYRDRAQERRKHFGPEVKESKNYLREDYRQAHTVQQQLSYDDPKRDCIKEDNIGNKMLQKMGWKSGTGLGKNKTGRTDIITAELRADKAGLGISATRPIEPNVDRYTKARHLTLARYKELDEKS